MDKRKVVLLCGVGNLSLNVARAMNDSGFNVELASGIVDCFEIKMPQKWSCAPILENTLVVEKNHNICDSAHPQPFYRNQRW